MSRLARLRKKVGYETDIPRCNNCTNFLRPTTYLVDSLPRSRPALCRLHDFTVKQNACCNNWRGTKGETLE